MFNNRIVFFTIAISILITSCSDPLDQKFNAQTFSDDIKKLNSKDQKIIKNVINAYQKNDQANEIAGSETVLIPSLTFREIKENYLNFHRKWRLTEKELLTKQLEKRWAQNINPTIFKNHIELTLFADQVKNPSNGYFSRKLILKNKFNESLSITGRITTEKLVDLTDFLEITFVLLNPTEHLTDAEVPDKFEELKMTEYIDSQDTHVKYIPDYKFNEDYKPTSDRELSIRKFSDYFVFSIDSVKYDFSSFNFLEKYSSDSLVQNKIKPKKQFLASAVDSLFPVEFWPYDEKKVSLVEQQILQNDKLTISIE